MMKYERLTERKGYSIGIYVDKDFINKGQWQNVRELVNNTRISNIENVFDRLAELEDKMENGTLIELPCKVGDTVYRITQSYRGNEKITIYTVREIIIDKKGVTYLTIALKGASSITCKVNVDSVFLTREEAEAKLKELQNG